MAHEDDDDDDDLLGPRGGDGRKLKANDNGGPDDRRPKLRAAGAEAAKELRNGIERIERLEEEKAATASDIKEVYAELKGRGYDTKAIRKIIAERKQDADALMEFESILDVYRHALGMI